MIDDLDRDRMLDMVHYAKTAVRLAGKGIPKGSEAFEDNYLALCRSIELVGEAATLVSKSTRYALPDVEWREAIAMRHRLVHGYFAIRPEVVFDTALNDLPAMISALERALGSASE
jgi:uncharacterized protein with HEPN domain